MKFHLLKYLLIIVFGFLLKGNLHAQFFGGIGDGFQVAALSNPDPCGYYFGDTTSGFTFLHLPNPDPCGYFFGDSTSGFNYSHLVNPDSCGFFEGSSQDGFAMFHAPSTVACPTFYGSAQDGFAMGFLSCVPLPVDATDLQGKMKGENAFLWWDTFSEMNSLGFSLLRSEDALNWQEIAFMEGSELSDSLRNYFHTDEEKPYGISYYKWMQIDYDGRTRYSNIVPLLKSDIGAELEVVLYPVPLPKGDLLKLHYKSPDREPVSMSISDIYGRILLQKNQNKEMDVLEVEFSTEKLSAGSYFLIIDHPVRPIVRRFFVY